MLRSQPRYRLGDKIGDDYLVHQALMGGMGEVYFCTRFSDKVPCALKTFQKQYIATRQVEEFFHEEAATWMALGDHLHIVRCLGVHVLDNTPFMILNWIPEDRHGRTSLRDWLRNGRLDTRIALDYTIQIGRGLRYAGLKVTNIVHCDLKPENILIARGRICKITDFGLAQVVGRSDRLGVFDARPGGTPPYMPPEQWALNAKLDARTDIYALGCILYEMLCGQHPFRLDLNTAPALERQDQLAAWRRLHEEMSVPVLPPGVPDGVKEIVYRCLEKQPERRFENIGTLLQALTSVYQNLYGSYPELIQDVRALTSEEVGLRGMSYLQLDRNEQALEDFTHVIESNPYNSLALASRGLVFRQWKRYEEALADFNHAISVDPILVIAYIGRCKTLRDLGRIEEALADVNYAIDLAPSLEMAHWERGRTLNALARPREALESFNRAIELNPNEADYFNDRGSALCHLDRFEDALKDYSRAIELDPDIASIYNNRGNLYLMIFNRQEEALQDLNHSIEIDPQQGPSYFGIGFILAQQGQLSKAMPYLDRAVQLGFEQGRQIAAQVRSVLGQDYRSADHLHQMAIEAFLSVRSRDAMRILLANYPFMAGSTFINAIEHVIAPERESDIEQRLLWLRQLVVETPTKRPPAF